MLPLGNLLLVAASVLLVALGRLQLSAMPGGDRGVGFAFALLWGHGAMVLLMLAVTAVLAIAGKLSAVPVAAGWQGPAAFAFVAVSTLVAAAVAVAAPSGAPQPWSLDALMRLAPLMVPLLLIICAALLLNGDAPSASGATFIRRSLQGVTLFTVAMALVGAAPVMASRVRAWKTIATRDPSTLDSNEQWILSQIDSGVPSQQFVSLLGYTRAGNHPTIRARALEKLQSVPGWEQRVADELAGANAPEVFTFLSANDVPNRSIFAAPIAKGIEQEALLVRERIRRASHPSHLYEGLMIFEVDALLQTTEKFAALGTDYAPAMQQLRDAFSERSGYPHPRYRAVQAIDRWLKKRR